MVLQQRHTVATCMLLDMPGIPYYPCMYSIYEITLKLVFMYVYDLGWSHCFVYRKSEWSCGDCAAIG